MRSWIVSRSQRRGTGSVDGNRSAQKSGGDTMAPRSGPQLLRTAALLVTVVYISTGGTSAEPVFISEVYSNTFLVLLARQCRPADFDASEITPQARASLQFASDPASIPAECSGQPTMALYYNVFASSVGLLSADATSFDEVRLLTLRNSFSADARWLSVVSDITDRCRARASPDLTARQLAVYTYGCLKWSLFADCDIQQTERGALDESGLLRRARFLTGSCPTSPDTLQEALQQATGRSVEECRQGLYSGDDAQQLYDAGVSLVTCLLQDFIQPDGFLNQPWLRAKTIHSAPTAARQLLKEVVMKCAKLYGPITRGYFMDTTAEEFAQCWAASGVFTCAIQEANQMASDFPTDCAMSVNVD